VSVSSAAGPAAAINLMVSQDEGETWGPPRRLVASPFFNISPCEGSAAAVCRRATGLPVYHEFLGKSPSCCVWMLWVT